MPDLDFSVAGAEAVTFAASPQLSLRLRVRNADETEKIQSVVLRCQIQIEPTKRRYSAKEQERLLELFGEPERWARTVRPMLWAHTSTIVRPFEGELMVDLPVPCTFDFNVGATKYFAGLHDGVVPLNLLFSGTIFYESDDAGLQVTQISWNKEARFKLPISVWQDMMDHYYPNSAWLCLRRDVFEDLSRYKRERGFATWEQTLESLLPRAGRSVADEDLAIEGSLPS